MKLFFAIAWTFGICILAGVWYAKTYHRPLPIGLAGLIGGLASGSAYLIVYLYHKSKKDAGDDGPSSWL
jgi:hypothetical protein